MSPTWPRIAEPEYEECPCGRLGEHDCPYAPHGALGLCDNSNDGRPCRDPETDESCPQCEAYMAQELAYWRGQWAVASPAERDPQGYAQDMHECGRGHLLSEDEMALVRR
jgi:hypothetical protein